MNEPKDHRDSSHKEEMLEHETEHVDEEAPFITDSMPDDEKDDEEIESLLDIECQLQSGIDLSTPKRRGLKKYKESAKSFLPFRTTKVPKDELPEAKAGFFSLLTYAWLTSIMWKLYKKPSDFISNLRVADQNRAEVSADRLERLWQEELKRKGPEKASFGLVVLKATRTRLVLGGLTFILSVTFSFFAPAVVLKRLLDGLTLGNMSLWHGIGLVVLISVMEFCRSMLFALGWVINYTTGVRMRGATLSLLYQKVLRLRSLKDKTVGEIVNVCANDGQRLFEACAIGPLLIGGPVILLYGIIYTLFLIGPWSLVGSATYLAFYPFMAFISRVSAYFRRKGIVITDKRVRMMTELLTCIKLIKMYAWEKSFAKTIAKIRSDERKILEKAAMVQGLSTASAPMVPIMASVFVILAHVLTGNDLTAAQTFTLLSVYNAMRFSLGIIPYSARAVTDALVGFKRFKAFTLISVYGALRSALGPIPYAVRSISDVQVSFPRFKAFTFVALTATQKRSMKQMTALVKTWVDFKVGGERMKSIFLMEEIKPHGSKVTNANSMVILRNCVFGWDVPEKNVSSANGTSGDKLVNGKKNTSTQEEQQSLKDRDEKMVTSTLQDINITLHKGELIGVCGSVGCGKSSLISAILGRMILLEGKIGINGSIAYVAQQAWIMNTTVRENILFGQMYEEDKYNTVVKACSLEDDFADFVSGDLTEIGERGINLSGGQKQRISLARALYADRDIYLLDDPLSAVDIHVGRHIFSECVQKCLKDKTVLFVTHQLQYLNLCDGILVMKDGRITEKGKHADLMTSSGEYAALISKFYDQEQQEMRKEMEREKLLNSPLSPKGDKTFDFVRSVSISGKAPSAKDKYNRQMSAMSAVSTTSNNSALDNKRQSEGKLIVTEERAQGKVTAGVYWSYIQSAGGILVLFSVFFTYIISVGVQSGSSWWLSYWLNQGGGGTIISIEEGNSTVNVTSTNIRDNPKLHFNALIYGMAIVITVFGTLLRTYCFMKATLHASSSVHDTIFSKILSCPMKFFDTTPVGRIINRFSSDMDEIDVRLPQSAEVFIMNILLIALAIGSICVVLPWYLIALVPLGICFVVLNIVFSKGIRELKRLDSTSRSPMISHINASVQGINTIHAFNKTEEFTDRFHQLLNANTVPFFLFYSSNRWLAIRLDLLSVLSIFITGLLVIFSHLPPEIGGMAMAFAIQMTGLFQFTIRLSVETESRFISVERLQHYTKYHESEAPAIVADNRPAEGWPNEGLICFKKVKMRYRENLPLALKGVSFDVLPREQIGIVGRSGSGKSSLGIALFRLVEIEEGSILIDGVDISKIGLFDLRSKLAIIPQDPVLFVGTIRYNLDPFQQFTDGDIWEALQKCHMKETIGGLEHQLDAPVVENGENFSVGERQLICLARALLRNSKILMLDEATAAIDTETDSLVQQTIKETFSDCTMLIIAHRLNTVLHCSRILVMDEGKVAEFDTPSKLLSNPKSKFKTMLEASESQHHNLH